MARKLVVEVVGDSASLERAFARSTRSAQKFDRSIGSISRGAIGGSGVFQGLGRSVAFASASFLGGFGLVAAVRSAFDEMSDAQKAAAQTSAAIRSTGGVAGITAKHVDQLATSLLNLSGVDDEAIKGAENLLLTFTNVRNVLGKNNDIFDQATKAALDLSVRFGKDLPSSAVLVGKALQDPIRGLTALQRVGVQFTDQQRKQIKAFVENGRVMDAQKIVLRELQREVGGSARAFGDTFAGKLSKVREILLNLGGSIAGLLLPSLTKLVDRFEAWLQSSENQQRILDDVRKAGQAVADVFDTARGVFEDINKVTGSTKETLKLLFAALVAIKGLEMLGALRGIATGLGIVGANATTATGEVTALRGALGGLAALTGITIAIELVLHKKQIEDKLGDLGVPGAHKSGLDILDSLFGDAARGGPVGLIRKFTSDGKKEGKQLGDAIGKALNAADDAVKKAIASVRDKAGALPPGVVAGPTKKELADIAARQRAAREAARQAVQDQAELAVDRAGLTKSVSDDIAALEKLNALLKRRIAGGHGTIELQRQQIGVEKEIADLVQQQAEDRARAAKAARDARQFRLLGFGPTGDDLVPGLGALKKQLSSVTDVISGTFLDTRKTRGLLAHIRQVLAGGLGSVSSEVRSKIQQILADLRGQLKQSSVDVTKFQETARGQFTLAGAHPGGGLTINGGIHLHGVQDVKGLEDALAKRRKQRAHARRSTR